MEGTTQNKGKNIGMAVVAYIIFFIPLLTESKNDPFVKYHVKQGLVLLICGIAVSIIVNIIPVFYVIIAPILDLVLLVLLIIGIMNAVNGLEKPLPLIGHFADKFNF
jgi:uncharacterized membrane protein